MNNDHDGLITTFVYADNIEYTHEIFYLHEKSEIRLAVSVIILILDASDRFHLATESGSSLDPGFRSRSAALLDCAA